MGSHLPPAGGAPRPGGSAVAAVRVVERLFEAGAVVGVLLYVTGFVTGQVDPALGVYLGVGGAAGNLALGFGRTVVLESADDG
ncbi:MAG: hypothetical protein ABEJ81_03115 [Haloferacaceae archaeon]